MIPIKPALSYFRDCYRLDTRTVQLDNFFGRKVELRKVLKGREMLMNAELPYLPLDEVTGGKMASVLQLYGQEKALYYCTFFVVGYGTSTTGKRQRICAPLFLYESSLEMGEDGYEVKISPEKRVINVDVLNHLKQTEEDVRSEISQEVPADGFDFGRISKLRAILEASFTELDTEELMLYPQLSSETAIKKHYQLDKIKEGGYHVVPAAGLGIMARSDNTQGIMTELAEMADKQTSLPMSVMSLFGYKATQELPDTRLGYVPAILNEAQQKIIDNAHDYHLSVAIGPPGTGKSFTIASLAIEYMSRGQSVLIVSKSDQAVDVIDKKIQNDLGIANATVRAGKKDYLRELKARIEGILMGMVYYKDVEFVGKATQTLTDLQTRIEVCDERVKLARKGFQDLLGHEGRWGDALTDAHEKPGFINNLKAQYINWLTSRSEPHWHYSKEYMNALHERIKVIKEFVELSFSLRIRQTRMKNRQILRKLLSAIRARTSSRRQSLFDQLDFQALFGTLPIWLCKLSDLHQVLPFQKKLFDVVIIDEATQCDIASCLPAIYRAERAVIVGDPKQLRHVSFLSNSAQFAQQKKYGLEEFGEQLDYRDQSILDFVDHVLDTQDQLTLLNEHYRSLPDLIEFSNRHFYAGGLKIMNVIPSDHSKKNIYHIAVAGTRSGNGVNEAEAERALSLLIELIDEEKELDQHDCRTIGVLSPFRAQVDHINQLFLEKLTAETIARHDILCGTAHSFQGEERDIMILSFCLDNEAHATGFRHINRADVFNVSVTRARSMVQVLTSFDLGKLPSTAYLRQYLNQGKMEAPKASNPNEVHDAFMAEVNRFLSAKGFTIKAGYEVADLSLDLAVIKPDELVAIDLIGYTGAYQEGLSLTAYKVLHRAGIRTFPLPFSQWKLDRAYCKDALLDFLNQDSEL